MRADFDFDFDPDRPAGQRFVVGAEAETSRQPHQHCAYLALTPPSERAALDDRKRRSREFYEGSQW